MYEQQRICILKNEITSKPILNQNDKISAGIFILLVELCIIGAF
jgi:hypothetical protein